MSDYEFLIDNMTWSFSRINAFHNCKHEWLLSYIECEDRSSNFYAEFGKYCHEILEKFANGELEKKELVPYYEEYFDDNVKSFVYHKTADIRQSYYEKGKAYFENFDLDLSKYEVLGVEKKCKYNLEGKKFIGYIDLLLKDENGDIIVLDHKSSEYPFTPKGKMKKAKEEDFRDYKRQLYLYAKQVFNEYGVFPRYLWWNFFKFREWVKIDFIMEEYEEALEWALKTIKDVYDEADFSPNIDYFYCSNLCSFRNGVCEFRN